MEDQAEFDLAYGQIKELHKLCCGDNLSLTALQQKINTLAKEILDPGEVNAYDDTPFLHYACSNKNLTLEIIQYLLEEWATGLTDVHPLCPDITAIHFLCCNEDCPDDVIRFLFKEHPEVFERMCLVDDGLYETYDETYASGLPIHYYLSRNKNVNIDTVKMLVEAYPQCLMTSCGGEMSWPCYPIHALLYNQNANNIQEILTYLIELEPSSVHMLDGNDSTPLHVVCENKNVSLDIVRFIYYKWPEAIMLRDDPYEALPIHKLCHNEMVDDNQSLDILRFMINIDPAMVRVDDEESNLPLHNALTCKPFAFCKVLNVPRIGKGDDWHERFSTNPFMLHE